ncbi:MAG: TonB-dependent receptor, partial [Gemmatimonadota bacterium]|nr:TonB-dependent receptor [Gemmatimonadota bacterium]
MTAFSTRRVYCGKRAPTCSLFVVVALLATMVEAASGQVDGAVRGTVRDAASGRGIPAATVTISPLNRQVMTDSGGRYAVRVLRPGRYRILARAVGYAPATQDTVEVRGGQTTVVDLVLRSEAVALPGIVVEAQPDPVLDPRVAATARTITREELRDLPVSTLAEAVAIQPGVVGGSYRGGRVGQELYILDGLGIKNQLDASGGALGLRIPTAALEEATVITNGFSARYGQALSGMVSAVTRDGPDRFEGGATYETDRPLGDGGDYGLDRVVALLGGPLLGGATFLAVLDAAARIDADPVNAPPPEDPLDPRAARPWMLPHNSGERFDAFAKLTVPFGSRHVLRLSYVSSAERRQLFDPVVKYDPAQRAGQEITGRLGFAHYQYGGTGDVSGAGIVDVRVGLFEKEAVRSVLLDDPSYRFGAFSFGGFDFAGRDLARARDSSAAEVAVSGFVDPMPTSSAPWGVPAFFYTAPTRGELAWNRYREARIRVDGFVGRGAATDVRVGAEYVAQRVETFTRLEAFRTVMEGAPAARTTAFSPFSAGAYAELQQRWSDVTVTAGLRGDAFDARGGGTEALGETKVTASPRLSVAMALGGATVVASVGRFVQPPDFQYLTDAAFDDTLRTGRFRRGNPALGFETATQAELQVRIRASRTTAVRAGAYLKRLDGLVASVPVGLDPDSAVFGNADYGTVRGLEGVIEREAIDGLGFRISYVFQDAQATATNALDFYRRLRISPVGDTIIPAVVTFPLDFDRRHAFVGVLLARTMPAAPRVLRDVQASAVGQWGSGLPYSRTTPDGDSLLGAPNGGRLPSQWNLDIRVSKGVTFGGVHARAYLDVRNVTNHRNIVAVRRDTGSPAAGEPQIEALAQDAYAAGPAAIPYESPAYRPEADLDGNRLLEGDELLPLYRRAARDFLQPLFAFGPPRLVR